MKKIYFIISLTAFIVFAVSCHTGSSTVQTNSEMKNSISHVYYTCTMHPEVHSDKPGKCPKCGMELVQKEETKSDSSHVAHQADSIK